MSRKNGNRYSNEFKKQLVDLYHSGTTVTELSGEYGVSGVTIYKWIQNLSEVEISEDETITLEDHKALKNKIARLEMENEILKKATAIFARKQ